MLKHFWQYRQFTSLTLILDLADVSRKAEFHVRARPCPWSLPTTRSSSKSHLLPTRIIGTCHTQTQTVTPHRRHQLKLIAEFWKNTSG